MNNGQEYSLEDKLKAILEEENTIFHPYLQDIDIKSEDHSQLINR